jgi:hypothetical protein
MEYLTTLPNALAGFREIDAKWSGLPVPDGRSLMISEWRFRVADHVPGRTHRERWQHFVRHAFPGQAPDLRFTGTIEGWACIGDDGRMWITSLHASEFSIEESLTAIRTIDELNKNADGEPAMIRHYSGPITDIFCHGRGSILRQLESGPGPTGADHRWLMLTRWHIRSDGTEDVGRFERAIATLSPLITPLIEDFGPRALLAVDPGDSTLALAGMFTSSTAMEGAWQAMREPGPLRDALERHLILTEFAAGEVLDLFALGDNPSLSEANSPVPATSYS